VIRPLSKSFCGGPVPSLKRLREPEPRYAHQVIHKMNIYKLRRSDVVQLNMERIFGLEKKKEAQAIYSC